MRLAGSTPQTDLRPGGLPTDFFMEPERKPPRTMYHGSKQKSTSDPGPPHNLNYVCTTREAPHKQNYDQAACQQAESRPGSLCAHKQNCDQGAGRLAGWLAASGITYDQGTCPALGWLSGWLGGWLASWLPCLVYV